MCHFISICLLFSSLYMFIIYASFKFFKCMLCFFFKLGSWRKKGSIPGLRIGITHWLSFFKPNIFQNDPRYCNSKNVRDPFLHDLTIRNILISLNISKMMEYFSSITIFYVLHIPTDKYFVENKGSVYRYIHIHNSFLCIFQFCCKNCVVYIYTYVIVKYNKWLSYVGILSYRNDICHYLSVHVQAVCVTSLCVLVFSPIYQILTWPI